MISGASEEELIEAIGRADVLLEFMPKIKQLKQENQQLKKINNNAIEYIKKHKRKDEFLELNEWGTRELLQILEDKEV